MSVILSAGSMLCWTGRNSRAGYPLPVYACVKSRCVLSYVVRRPSYDSEAELTCEEWVTFVDSYGFPTSGLSNSALSGSNASIVALGIIEVRAWSRFWGCWAVRLGSSTADCLKAVIIICKINLNN